MTYILTILKDIEAEFKMGDLITIDNISYEIRSATGFEFECVNINDTNLDLVIIHHSCIILPDDKENHCMNLNSEHFQKCFDIGKYDYMTLYSGITNHIITPKTTYGGY